MDTLEESSALSSPAPECSLCSRLYAFREQNALEYPDWFNKPVPSFGSLQSQVLIVGLAPGLQGANKTGRPFTGDYAGDLLYATLKKYGFAQGNYEAHPDDNLQLINCMITNAVRCVPPQNKPIASEINTCQQFLKSCLTHMDQLKIILVLGRIAHDSTLAALGHKKRDFPFKHGGSYPVHIKDRSVYLCSSYHCSRYNTNTGRLTQAMFEDVFVKINKTLNK
ncbi:MAG: uracil-DNA glycosylase [Pseudomonadota bacterium]